MRSELELKNYLQKLKEDNWELPENEAVNKYELILELLSNLGSTDFELRDLLIYEFLCELIESPDINDDQIRRISKLLISDDYLFLNIEKHENDAVFKRTFTALIIVVVLYRHINSNPALFSKEEVLEICSALIKYMQLEKDVRGYVDVKGWAHSAAHTADALAAVALCEELEKANLLDMLQVIHDKICIDYYAYINGEDERLMTAVINMFNRNLLSIDEFCEWIRSFDGIEIPKVFPQKHYFMSNHKNFLSAMYFRFNRREVPEVLLSTIVEVINNSTPVFFK